MPNRVISQATQDLILNLYKTGLTTHKVAAIAGTAQSYVIKVLKRHNIERRSIYSYTRIYNVNEQFFDKIDTEAKAYFLGLMFADGNNYRSEKYGKGHSYQISIHLQEGDKHILETFRDLIVPNKELIFGEPKNKRWKNKWGLRFDSKIVSNQLIKLGCVPAKSLILEYPADHIPKNLQAHFLRGYFDGDGCISYWIKQWKTTTNQNYNWSIVSTANFCAEAAEIISQNVDLGMYSRIAKPDSNNQITTTITIGGNQQVYRLMSWLYQDATIFLQRKYDKFLELKSQLGY